MSIENDTRVDSVLRLSGVGALSSSAVSISSTVLGAITASMAGTYSASEVQTLRDAIAEINKLVTG